MTATVCFVERKDSLGLSSSRYFQDLLYRTIKIGTELEFALPKGVLRQDFQPEIEALLQPSRDMNRLGRLGVYDVIKEHCGIEVLVIGRHPHWDALRDQYQRIIAPLLERGVRMRPTCGLHFHLIGIGLAEEIPEIILANLWNMARCHAPALKFLASCGECRDGLCRRRQHNAHLEFMRNSPVSLSMPEIQARLKDSLEVPEHQNFFNIEHVRFAGNGSITDFHIELRFPDGDLSPVSITAKTFLFLCMLLKAVEISKFGLLDAESVADWEERVAMMDRLSNNDGRLATSDTSGIDDRDLDRLRAWSRDLLDFLKSIFLILDNPAEQVLLELAREPVSLRRARGLGWEEVDRELSAAISPPPVPDRTDFELVRLVELGLLTGQSGQERWHAEAAGRLGLSPEEVGRRLRSLADRRPAWDEDLGSMVFLR